MVGGVSVSLRTDVNLPPLPESYNRPPAAMKEVRLLRAEEKKTNKQSVFSGENPRRSNSGKVRVSLFVVHGRENLAPNRSEKKQTNPAACRSCCCTAVWQGSLGGFFHVSILTAACFHVPPSVCLFGFLFSNSVPRSSRQTRCCCRVASLKARQLDLR